MTVGGKIKELRLKKQITQEELGKLIGVSTSMIGMYETDGRRPGYDKLTRLAELFDVSTDFLLFGFDKALLVQLINYIRNGRSYEQFAAETGLDVSYITKLCTGVILDRPSLETIKKITSNNPVDFLVDDVSVLKAAGYISGEKQNYEVGSEKSDATFTQQTFTYDDLARLPIIGFVPAGGPIMTEENLDGHLLFPKMFVKGEKDFILKVKGDSMEDIGINDRDMVLVHPQPTAENGQTVIARINNEVTCKRFYIRNNKCVLEPANKKYKPIDCNELEIVGIVTKVIKDVF